MAFSEHVRARRAYGQNFLSDPAAIRAFLTATGVGRGDLVLEVGAGRGSLTAGLVRRARHVVAFEVDPAMAAALPRRPGLTVRAEDFLAAEPPHEPFAVAGNVPYALTAAVVEWCLGAPMLTSATLLTQLEYARKRTGDYGRWSRLTIRTWPRTGWRLVGRVPRTAFRPVPAVDGGILRLENRPAPLVRDQDRWQDFVDLGFTGTGGSLHATMTRRFGARRVDAAFRSTRLARDLPVGHVWPEQWLTLYRLLTR
ncbi:ErmE/ErmH/ErmO/ErmR family 23S rRNA (adenine(2058)-N(6))-methyltransferase [Symbioplanes lichenis]|uniref:ErmE/ErmH/ErmO/ErmR family 23S rRNA (adenine(2058)-N(6))-methyltransferase n=1 Tax=Symbioplanes lichenis TaxID=1629072 RepID=UPI0027391BA4|nr:ErmE/ErmH/ErmO/ErmR family 23S rRNA (adenine(2058)-N(6))-methyltransferase [Actinoplanes lichenis]